jgi:hypothetical protein
MPRSLSLTALQVNALTTSDDTILYNAQARDISLYGGTNLASLLTQLEIDNVSGDCLTLRCNGNADNYANFKMNSSGTFDVKINNGNKSFNIVNHNGSTFGLRLNGTLVTSTAAELNKLSGFTGTFANLDYLTGITPGTATAGKALVTDSSNNLVGINDLSTQNLTVAGTLVTASATELNYTDITTAGTAQAAKALVVDVNRDISNIRNLSATNLTGTLQTASQPNITSVGTLTNLTVSNQITTDIIDAGTILVDGVDITTAISGSDPTTGITPGVVSASKVLLVDSSKNLTGMGNLTSTGTITASTLAGTLSTASQPNVTTLAGVTSIGASSATTLTGTLQTAAQSNITSVGTLTGLTSNGNVNLAEHNGIDKGLQLGGTLVTAAASEINKLTGLTATTTELNKTAGVTPGTVSASKALVVDGNKDLSGIRNITTTGTISGAIGVSATTLTGTLSTASQPNITSVGTLTNLTVSNQITTDIIDAATILVDGVDITTAISGSDPTTGITPGVVSASKVLLVDSSKNLTGMGNLTSTGTITASTLAGTLSTASQSNITSVGTLTGITSNGNVNINEHDGSTKGLQLAGTLVTSTASDLNKLAGVTNGTTSASKALVVDSNKDLSEIRNITSTGTVSATTLTGTLSTASQSNITSVGTLTSLTSNNDVNIAQHDGSTKGLKLQGTLVTATAADLNKLSGVTEGTVSSSKVIITDTNKDLSGIRNLTTTGTISGVTTLTATTVAGTLSTTSQPNITSVGTLLGVTSNGNVDIAEHDGITKGLKLAGTLVNATATDLNKLSNVTASAADLNTTTGVNAGTVTASKHLVVDSNKDLTGMGNLTSTGTITASTVSGTTLTGTLSAGAQDNVTTLTGATSVGQNSSTTLTGTLATASQPNVTTLAGVTSIGASNTTTLTGTLATASQPNITSVGTLTSLALSGAISDATTISSSGIITNTDSTASTSNSTGAVKLSGGIGISNTTDATSSTNGGTFTTAGGAAIAKKLYVGSDLTVGGNLTISGTTTTINSTTTTINDNTLLLNSGPSGTGFDAGVLTQRYQIDNSAGTGDVVSDTAKESYAISSGTTSTITLPGSASSTNDYYNNWWVKITSGTLINNVRKITAYNGTTKVATLSTILGSAPSANDNVNLYNKSYTSLLWNEGSKKFVSAFTSNDISTPGALNIIDYADFTAKNITGTLETAAQPNITSVGTLTSLTSSGAVSITNSTTSTSTTTGALKVTGGAGIAGSLYVGEVLNITRTTNGRSFNSTNGTSTCVLYHFNNGDAYFGTTTNNNLIFQTNNTTRLTLSNTGNLTSSGDVSTSGNISTTGTGTITSAGLLTASAGLTVTGTLTLGSTAITASADEINYNDITAVGTAQASKALVVDSSINIAGINSLSCTSLTVNGTSITSGGGGGTPAELTGVTAGTASASKALVVDSSINITGINNLTLNGTSSILSLSGASSVITLSNTTASTSSSTGALRVSGGAYFGANSLMAANLTLNGTSSTLSLSGASSVITLSNTTASTSSSTGALRVSGGAYFGANSLFNANLTTNGTIIAGNAALSASSWTTSGIQLRTVTNTYTNSSTASSGTAASAVFNSFARPALGAVFTSVTTTNAATVYIENSPVASTNMTLSNDYSLWINSGKVLFGTGFGSTNRSLATLTINANTLHTNGEAAAHGLLISGGNTVANACLYMGADNTNSVSYIQSSKTGNYLPLLLNNRGGGVGIGLNTVIYTLDVGGDINLTGALRFSGTAITASAAEINYLDITAAGTGQALKALVLNASSNITGINNLTLNGASSILSLSGASSVISISNTTASTSSTTGALRVSGGAYFGANSLFNANLTLNGAASLNTQNTGNVRTTLPTSYVSINDSPIYFRGTSGSDKNHFICYAGNTAQTNWNSGKGFGNPGTGNDGPVLCGNNNVIIGTLAGTGTETICANFTSTNTDFNTSISITNSTASTSSSTGALRVSGGAYFGANSLFASNVNINGTLTTTGLSISNLSLSGTTASTSSTTGALQVAGGAYFGANSIFNSTLRVMGQSSQVAGEGIEFGYSSNTANIYSFDRTGGTYKNINLNDKMYIQGSDGNVGIGTITPGSKLDVTGTIRATGIASPSSGTGVEIHYAASIGDIFAYDRTTPGYKPLRLNNTVYITSTNSVGIGTTTPESKLDVTGTIRATGITAPSSGTGVEINYSSDVGNIICYDRTNTTYKSLKLNHTISVIPTAAGGLVGIGPLTATFPLHVTSVITSTATASPAEKFSTSYGGSNWNNTEWGYCSAYFEWNVVADAFIGVSDERIKTNIEEIPILYCKEFVMNCTPVSYYLKEDVRRGRNNTQFGYIAQDLEKKGFHYLVTHIDNDSNEDLIEIIEDVNGKEYKSPQGTLLSISYTEIIPLLAQNIKALYLENEDQQNEINELKQKNIDLETRLAKLEAFISTLEIAE